MPISAELLLDTSAAIVLISPANERHQAVLARTAGRRLGLPGHAVFETYSVLTRLPAALRLTPRTAHRLMEQTFPGRAFLEPGASDELLRRLVDRGVAGGAVWDALVGAAAAAHGVTLLSCDRRASATYAALGVAFEIIE